jgi:hypothetical protein
MAGIYALERIMRDSEKDHETIVQLMAAFIRERAPKVDYPDDVPWGRTMVKNDVQAALTVLGYRPERTEDFSIDLRNTSLRGANLAGVRMEGVVFALADLMGARLTEAHLAGANFFRATLGAVAAEGVDLCGAHMDEAFMEGGHFHRAKMRDASMREVSLAGADLQDAELGGVNLAHAKLIRDDGTFFALVEASQLLETTVISGTRLPDHLLADTALVKHIADCDEKWPAEAPKRPED